MWARWLISVGLVGGCGAADSALDCGPGVDQRAIEGQLHVNPPMTVSYRDNPPASGNHYPVPAPWGQGTYPRETWVHNLEHGGIVLLYNCPSGCDADVQKLVALRARRPADQFHEVRVLITPDMLMPHKFAAIAWGWRWQGDSLDESTISCFIGARYDRAPESIP